MPSKEKGIGIYHGPKVPMYKISHVRRGGQASSSNKATSL
jgi:hypothetical protein